MKKIMILAVLVGLLVFSVVTSAFASTAYIDYTLDGNTKVDSNNNDLDQYLVGVEIPLDQFKVGLEYANNTIKFNPDIKYTDIKLKAGYPLIKNDLFELYGNLSYLHRDADHSRYILWDNLKYSPILIGVDAKYAINEKNLLTGNLDYAVSGKTKTDSLNDTDTDYTTAKVKYTYLFTKNVGAAVGYEWSKWKLNGSVDKELIDNGFTLGISYNF
jgi:predicted porin